MIPYSISRWLLFILSLLGVVALGYLSITHLRGDPIVCSASHGCDIIRDSAYSRIKGIPIALFGTGMYLVLDAMLILNNRRVFPWLITISGIGVAVSAYLTYLELYVIHAICLWCVASAVIITLFFTGTLLTQKPKELS